MATGTSGVVIVPEPVIASEAKQSTDTRKVDCFVAPLLAMTKSDLKIAA